jgi:hypothetical protein
MYPLYHLSTKIKDTTHDFIPRIPLRPSRNEDVLTMRISFSPTIEDCLNAFSFKKQSLQRFNVEGVLYLSCYTLTEKSIEEKYRKEKYIKTPNELVSEGKVKDALLTKEHWLLVPVYLNPTIIQITDIECKTITENGINIQMVKNAIFEEVEFKQEYVRNDSYKTRFEQTIPHSIRKYFLEK